MRAIQVHAYEGDDRLAVIYDAPDPDPGEGVLIDVHSAGASFPDRRLPRGTGRIQREPPYPVPRPLGARVLPLGPMGGRGMVPPRAGAAHIGAGFAGWRAPAVASNGGGFDMVYDPVGGQYNADENLRALVEAGRLVVIG